MNPGDMTNTGGVYPTADGGWGVPIPCGHGSSQDLPQPKITVIPSWPWPLEPLFKVKLLNPKGKVPTKSYEDDLGWDLYAAAPYTLWKGHATVVQTGIAIQPRKGLGYKIFDRSSMGLKLVEVHGGVYDGGYRGEVTVTLSCEDPQYYINEGDRIAQIVFLPIIEGAPLIVEELDPSERGEKHWGSSGR